MQLSTKLKLFFKDHFHLVFKGSANNYQRLQQCLPDENGDVTCSVSFSSYTELKKYQKKLRTATVSLASAIAMVIVALIVSPYIFNPSGSQASSFQWVQNSWGGTAKTDPASKTGETDYSSKDTNVVAAAGGVSLVLPAAISVTETNDADFSGTKSGDGTYVNGSGKLFLRKPGGVACSANQECASNECMGFVCTTPCDGAINCGDSCSYGGQVYGTVYISNTTPTQCWMTKNLGAKNVASATTYNDQNTYGWLFQWGRSADGHQYTAWGSQSSPASSGTTSTPSATDTPGHANFITSSSSYDWRNPQSDNLWATASGSINNPCPTGWHVPTGGTGGEWDKVMIALGIKTCTTDCLAVAAGSVLHLPANGGRSNLGSFTSQGSQGFYWSSSPDSGRSYTLLYTSTSVNLTYNSHRVYGRAVRCIKN